MLIAIEFITFLCITMFELADQGTQTDSLLITEKTTEREQNGQERGKSECSEDGARSANEHSPSPQREILHKIHKSASFSSSSGNSLGGSSPLGSATSTTSLHYSPIRPATRTLKNDSISTYQKWESTVESISYVSRKTVAISDYGSDVERPRSNSVSVNSQTTQSRSTSTTPVPGPVPAVRNTTVTTATPSGNNAAMFSSTSTTSSGIDSSSCGLGTTYKATTTTSSSSSSSNTSCSRINGNGGLDHAASPRSKLNTLSKGSPLSVKQTGR